MATPSSPVSFSANNSFLLQPLYLSARGCNGNRLRNIISISPQKVATETACACLRPCRDNLRAVLTPALSKYRGCECSLLQSFCGKSCVHCINKYYLQKFPKLRIFYPNFFSKANRFVISTAIRRKKPVYKYSLLKSFAK